MPSVAPPPPPLRSGPLGWVDLLPVWPRRLFVGGSVAALGVASVLTEQLPTPMGRHALAIGVVVVGIASWGGVYRRFGMPRLAQRRDRQAATQASWVQDRGLIAQRAADPRLRTPGMGGLILADPTFSLPTFFDEVESLPTARTAGWRHGPVHVARVVHDATSTRIEVRIGVQDPDGTLHTRTLRVSRPAEATSSTAEGYTNDGDAGWVLDEVTTAAGWTPAPPPEAGPHVAAGRRALMARAEDPDLASFGILIAQIEAVLEDPNATTMDLETYATPRGVEAVAWWREGPGLPAGGSPQVWLEVEEDGWYERIEIRSGSRVLGLLRLSGDPEAPWRLWRLR